MKKAEDYIIETETDHWADQDYCKSDIIRWIKQAQIDAIEETVKKCAENVTHTAGQWYSDYSCMKRKVEKVADQLKKDLE